MHSSVHDIWRRLVVLYSEKRITQPSDTLPALAGLAQKWSFHVKPGKYLAGLWSTDIFKSLLWRVNNAVAGASRTLQPQKYIAPSWSWASTQQPVTWDRIDLQDIECFVTIHLDSSGCQAGGPDPFGRLEAGWLCITGRTFEAQVALVDEGNALLHTDGFPRFFRFTPDNLEHCQTLVGQHLTCLVYSTNPPLVDSIVVIVLAQALLGCFASLPPAVQKHPHVFQRLGVIRPDVEGWDHVAQSKELTFYLV